MNLSAFLTTWRGTQLENRISRLVILALAAAVFVLTLMLGRVERTVVLVPPEITGPVEIARDSASREAQEAWALYVAELLGNVTPQTGEFLIQVLEPLLAASLRRDVMEVLSDQVEEIRRERVSMRFEPREIAYEEASQTVYVSGFHTTEGPGGMPIKAERTYEVRVSYRNYRPLVTHLDVYPGAPRTPAEKSVDAELQRHRDAAKPR